MRWDGRMEILSSPSCYSRTLSSPPSPGLQVSRWNPAENKAFENALALFDENTPHRWHMVAAMVPTKTVLDVIRQYRELQDDVTSIEAGLVPFPVYSSAASSPHFTLHPGRPTGHSYSYSRYHQQASYVRRSTSSLRLPHEHDRKKGIPWTEEEHKLFLMGLRKYGKGDWRNISRNFVITRTPTQVASHAQKYFIRQLSRSMPRCKDKRRASIHDITTANLNEYKTSPFHDDKNPNKETICQGRSDFASYGIDSYRLNYLHA